MKRALVQLLPGGLKDWLRAQRKSLRRARYSARERVAPVKVEERDIVDALRRAGIEEGDTVFVQCKMSAFGELVGGPSAVIDAFRAAVGPDGNIAMPAFSLTAGAAESLRAGAVFDVRDSPSTMGAVSEAFRKREGALRSIHPTHSVAVQGPDAASMVGGHQDAETPFGPGTPFQAMLERGGKQVWFGCGVGPFTNYHTFECQDIGGFPLDVFLPERFTARYIDADGDEGEMTTLAHDPALASIRIDARADIQRRFHALLVDGATLSTTSLGRGEILVGELPTMMTRLRALLDEGITIYDVTAASPWWHSERDFTPVDEAVFA
jgi:aminoglycoside 3-N-acetyltransferase